MPTNKRMEEEFSDYLDTVEIKDWLERARRDMFPKLAGSAMSLMIFSSEPDAKLCLELGAAILFDKPIILLSTKQRPIPEKLRRLAHTVVEVDDITSPETQAKLQAAITSVIDGLKHREDS
jgi:hypothetical protein